MPFVLQNDKMKIFPHILCRVSSLSFDELKRLNLSDEFCDLLNTQRLLENKFEKCKAELLVNLKSFDATFLEFSMIRKMKKLVHKNRLLNTIMLDFTLTLGGSCGMYNDLLNQKNEIAETVERTFEIENLRTKTELQYLAQNPNFQNALPLSSVLFAKSLRNYLNKNPKHFRKKELQTEQTVMQYMARMAAKTSPFSSFTKVSSVTLQSSEKKYISTSQNGRMLSYNNFLLQLFQSLFISNSEISNYLNIRINSTLEKDENEYRYLVNVQNVEGFQRVEIQGILERIEFFFIENEVLTKLELLEKMEIEIEGKQGELLGFVAELIEIGFLEIEFGFHGNMDDWLEKISDFVKVTIVFDEADFQFFQYLKIELADFRNAKIWERIEILEKMYGAIQAFLEKYGFEGNLKEILPIEELIYEDIGSSKIVDFEEKAIEKLIFPLHELLEKVNFLKGKERLQIDYFFNQYYNENAIVPLLDFHESYSKIGKQIKEIEIPAIQAEAELLKNWAKAVGEVVLEKYKFGEELKLEIKDFEYINEQLNMKPKQLKNYSLACFAQMFEEDAALKAVLNAVTLGYGKMTGRFLKLMPKPFTEDLQRFNAELTNETLMADNVDASFFNANIHPMLLTYEISMPKSQNQLSKKQQLNVMDLAIRKVNDEVILWHLKLKKRVQVFDLGIQTPKGRAPLYQLLMNFSPIVPNLQYLKEAIEKVIPQTEEKYVVFPRVVFENWVLFRKRWIFQDWESWCGAKKNSDLEQLKNLKSIFFQKKIRNHFYIKMISKSTDLLVQNRKTLKPSYMIFNNLFLSKKFNKNIKNKNMIIEIHEMFPKSENLLKINSQAHYIENVLQWYN